MLASELDRRDPGRFQPGHGVREFLGAAPGDVRVEQQRQAAGADDRAGRLLDVVE